MQMLMHQQTRFRAVRLNGSPRTLTRRALFDPQVADIAFVCIPEFEGPADAAERLLSRFADPARTDELSNEATPMAWAAKFELDGLPLHVWPEARCEVGRLPTGRGWWARIFYEEAHDVAALPPGRVVLPGGIDLAECLTDLAGSILLPCSLCTFQMDDGLRLAMQSLYAKTGWIFVVPQVNGATRGVLAISKVEFLDNPPDRTTWWDALVDRTLGRRAPRPS